MSRGGEALVDSRAETRKVVIVGAGPVGCLSGLAFAKAGWRVEIYEGRPDVRLPSSRAALAQRSVNLAISSRGLAALYSVDRAMMDRVLANAIPMKGRMVHTGDGKTESQAYDPNGQCINSIDRGLLNECLLEETAALPSIRVFFRHKLVTADFDARAMIFHSGEKDEDVTVSFDLCVGADGSYSNVRRQMMRVTRMDYQQEYIPHEYVELRIPAGTDAAGKRCFRLDPNHLHIWPRHAFMLIALPNKDKTFTCTLFAPTSELERLGSRAAASAWFRTNFVDAVDMMGEERLLDDFERNPRNALISLKAKPYHYRDRCVIVGDAAHSMVPFYGQGLNCGLEDVRILMSLLRAGAGDGLERALGRYSSMRHEDAVAISELAMDNYVEMRHSVTTAGYSVRKWVDNVFARVSGRYVSFATVAASLGASWTGFPPSAGRGWVPLYTMVTFRADVRYSAAKRKGERQSRIISGVGWACVGVGVWLGLMGMART